MDETILVTGATGTVGSEVVKQLSKNALSYNIKAGVHSVENANKIQQYDRVEAILIDYDKQEGLQVAFKGTDKLFLLTHPSSKSAEHESNLVSEAKRSGISHIVKQSIMGADLEADVEAMRLHRQAEKAIEESGISYTFLRPNEFMQGFINFQGPTIRNHNAFYIPAENAKVSIVDARDIASIAVKSLMDSNRHYNKTYLITGPEALSYHQAAEILSNATSKKIQYVNISDEKAREAMKEAGLDDWLINTILDLYSYFRKGYASQVASAVEEVTGKKPIAFAQFAKEHVDAFK
ncbi:MAG: SDR family oxidoreductase [Candidatus Nitrosocosmicus sp.]|nr:SDR family oxidoreductase [Candidatus Nitrosocosmicus sp.]MDN5867288.1 SDR family oxidoreductase [Candidatus Nitrosocosmicus sp.]